MLNLNANSQTSEDANKKNGQSNFEQDIALDSLENETWNDFLIAQMMQADMLAEAEEKEWKIMEAKNGNSKGSMVSFVHILLKYFIKLCFFLLD